MSQHSCEPYLVGANIEGLIQKAEEAGLGTIEIQAWSLRSVPGPLEFRRSLNSTQLPVAEGLKKLARTATLDQWPEIQKRVSAALYQASVHASERTESRDRTAFVLAPRLVHSWPTFEIDYLSEPTFDGGENIWFAYVDREGRVFQIDLKSGAAIIANPKDVPIDIDDRMISFRADFRMISRGPGRMPFLQYTRRRDHSVASRLIYGSEPYSVHRTVRFSDNHYESDIETHVVAWGRDERFAFRSPWLPKSAEVVDLTGRAKPVESLSHLSRESFLKTKDGRVLLVIKSLEGLQVLEYKGDSWQGVTLMRGSHFYSSPALAEGPNGDIWLAGLKGGGNYGKDTLELLEISKPGARVLEAPFHDSNPLAPLQLAVDEVGVPWVSIAVHNHDEDPINGYKIYQFGNDGDGTYRVIPREQLDNPFSEWIRDPLGRLVLANHEPKRLDIVDPHTLTILSSIPVPLSKAHILRTHDNSFVMFRSSSTRVELHQLFGRRGE